MTRPGTLSQRRQQQVLRSYPSNHLDRILCHPGSGISLVKAGRAGSSGHTLSDGSHAYLETTGRGISLTTRLGDADELLTCAQGRTLAKAVPADVRGELAEASRLRGVHERAYLWFTASAAAQGCSRGPASGPRTPVQAKYATGYPAWIQGVTLETWHRRNPELAADLVGLQDRAFPLTEPAGIDPADLLGMLEQRSPHLAAATVELRGVADHEVDQDLTTRDRGHANSP